MLDPTAVVAQPPNVQRSGRLAVKPKEILVIQECADRFVSRVPSGLTQTGMAAWRLAGGGGVCRERSPRYEGGDGVRSRSRWWVELAHPARTLGRLGVDLVTSLASEREGWVLTVLVGDGGASACAGEDNTPTSGDSVTNRGSAWKTLGE